MDNKLNDTTMKRIFAILAVAAASLSVMRADDRPVSFNQLPGAAQSFISMNFPDEKVSYATKDDDIILPDFTVVLSNGMKIQFEHDGTMDKLESRSGIPSEMIPVQIRDYVKLHYPDAYFIEYDVNRRSYEVKLSNRLELKFNVNFILVEIDD